MYLRSVWAFYNQKVTAAVVVVALSIACVLASMAVYLKMRHINWVILHSEFARGDVSLEEGGPGVDEVAPPAAGSQQQPGSVHSEPPTVVVDASGQQTLQTQSLGAASGAAGITQRTCYGGPEPSTVGAGTGLATATVRSDSIQPGPSIRQMRSERRRRLLMQQRKLFWLQQPIVMLRIIQASGREIRLHWHQPHRMWLSRALAAYDCFYAFRPCSSVSALPLPSSSSSSVRSQHRTRTSSPRSCRWASRRSSAWYC